MMVDEGVVYLAPSTVYTILDRYDLLYRWKRPEPGQGRRVPEATYPDEVWHVDLMYFWVKGCWYFLVSILDFHSRYIVYWELALSMRAQDIAEIVATALEQVPRKRGLGLSGITVLSLSPKSGGRSCATLSLRRFPSG
jgi:transposase InsO family protein